MTTVLRSFPKERPKNFALFYLGCPSAVGPSEISMLVLTFLIAVEPSDHKSNLLEPPCSKGFGRIRVRQLREIRSTLCRASVENLTVPRLIAGQAIVSDGEKVTLAC